MTRRYNKSLEFYFNLALFVCLIVFGALFLTSCEELGVGKKEKEPTTDCGTTIATVRDLTGLDGCRLVLELENGEILVPAIIGYCGTPPFPREESFWGSKAKDGMKVSISFSYAVDSLSACMAGKSVYLNCIKEVPGN